MIAKQTYYLTKDRRQVVEEGDVRAAWLLVRQGCEIPDVDARRYGLLPPRETPKPPAEPSVPDWQGTSRTVPPADPPSDPEYAARHTGEQSGDPGEKAAQAGQDEKAETPAADRSFRVGDRVRIPQGAAKVPAVVEAIMEDGRVKVDRRKEPLPASELEPVEDEASADGKAASGPDQTKAHSGPGETK